MRDGAYGFIFDKLGWHAGRATLAILLHAGRASRSERLGKPSSQHFGGCSSGLDSMNLPSNRSLLARGGNHGLSLVGPTSRTVIDRFVSAVAKDLRFPSAGPCGIPSQRTNEAMAPHLRAALGQSSSP